MGDKTKQVKAFRVQGGSEGLLLAEDFFGRLHNAEHPVKRKNRGPLQLQHVFSRSGGSNTFLIYLIYKATPNFVEAVAKDSLGPGYSTTCIHDRTRNESFLPVERKTETKISIIECEAAAMAEGDGPSASFILVDARQKVVYSYNDQGRLAKRNPKPRDAQVDVGSASDTPQVRRYRSGRTQFKVYILRVLSAVQLVSCFACITVVEKTNRALAEYRNVQQARCLDLCLHKNGGVLHKATRSTGNQVVAPPVTGGQPLDYASQLHSREG